DSVSNISTTALVWAALTFGSEPAAAEAAESAAHWIARASGGGEPRHLAAALTERYGKDRTFSVPILTMAALAGRLGAAEQAWRLITQLPFELAAFPQSWFRFLRLPVVSYALPALIAIGQIRHHQRPSWNPLVRIIRSLAVERSLEKLAAIQPASGGFLEATPLTSFVTMSLAGMGRADHIVARKGVEFLTASVRPDGSWPIDTNLATWITTLSVNALAARDGAATLSSAERTTIREWLLAQQYRTRHPYTGAPAGAWAWTDLPGGVPDADDTPGALLALHHLGDVDDRVTAAADAGVRWLLNLQNSDGGIPTFCRGWTNLPFDRSGPDLTAHTILAWLAWRDRLPARTANRIDRALPRALRYLERQQRPDGSWLPLWFGNQHAPDDENPTYGTAKVLLALLTHPDARHADPAARGLRWLLAAQNDDGGWAGHKGGPSSIEETALAVDAIALAILNGALPSERDALAAARDGGVAQLCTATQCGHEFPPGPIGFYFAKLWYFERDYPLIYTVGALGRAAASLRA
ncbi:MAG TPA: prenyltransferase/squalene oxidase repeat-containing protein, partial [Tepidisphaeraceae bacterium]|nr:prenyltransferase/squalene oxidase repeat-containing protein [Tepidisphaeraceae bacterium]